MMSSFNLSFKKNDNSHPAKKIALRNWIIKNIKEINVLDVYGAYGMMYDRVWKKKSTNYKATSGDSLLWLEKQKYLKYNVFDIDPYSSPYEAIEIICKKNIEPQIALSCTDGTLRRVAMMRTKIPKYLQEKCDWPERNLTLMASIYHKYPQYLRYVIRKIAPNWDIKKLTIQYGTGTWCQATVYFAIILDKEA